MVGSSPERWRWSVLGRTALIGAALALAALGGGGLILFDAGGLLVGTSAVVATLLGTLGIGVWAGAPDAGAADLPLRQRWVAAGLSVGLAGVFATAWTVLGDPVDVLYGRVAGLLVMVAAPGYALGLLLPLVLADAERREVHDAEPDDELAAEWGPVREIGLGLLGGAAVAALLGGALLIPRATPGPLLLGAALALVGVALLPQRGRAPATDEALLYEAHTPFGTLRVTQLEYPGGREAERRLYLNDEEESAQLVRSGAPAMAYIAAGERWLAQTTPPGAAYLFLGGGACTLPRRLLERDPSARATVVELDPEVTRVARRFFGLDHAPGVEVVHGDARAYLQTAREPVDRIYLDVYGGDETVPHALVTAEAFGLIRRLLRPGGTLGINLIGVPTGPEALRFWSVLQTAEEVFGTVALYLHLGRDYPERQNALVVAAPEAQHELPASAGGFERWPREEWLRPDGAVVLRDLAG